MLIKPQLISCFSSKNHKLPPLLLQQKTTQKNKLWPIKFAMEPGQNSALYVIVLPGLHCVSVWSGMPRRGFRARLSRTSSRQPPAFCCQAHLGGVTCARDPAGATSFTCVSSRRLNQRQVPLDTGTAERGSLRGGTRVARVGEARRYQIGGLLCGNGNKTKILQIITRKTLRILFWKCCDPHCSNYCILQPSELYFERADSLCDGFFVTKWGSEICFLGSSEVDGFNSVYKTAEDRPRKPT